MTATITRPVRQHDATGPGNFTGSLTLLRLHLRRDRVLLTVWILAMGLLPAGLVSATRIGYPTPQDMINFAQSAMISPSELATRGPVFAATLGGLVAWTIASSGALVQAVINILVAIRHTRADEQTGRQETLSAARIGRLAPLGSALLLSTVGNLGVGLVAMIGLLAQGMPAVGSIMLGAVFTCTGLFFAGLAALFAQLAQTGSAYALSFVALGVFFALAAAGDLSGSGLVWLTPIGWARHAQAFVGNLGWVLLLPLLGAALTMIIAGLLATRRDLGAGLLPTRPGRARATSLLSTPLGLAWRRHRAGVAGWAHRARLPRPAARLGDPFTGRPAEHARVPAVQPGHRWRQRQPGVLPLHRVRPRPGGDRGRPGDRARAARGRAGRAGRADPGHPDVATVLGGRRDRDGGDHRGRRAGRDRARRRRHLRHRAGAGGDDAWPTCRPC